MGGERTISAIQELKRSSIKIGCLLSAPEATIA